MSLKAAVLEGKFANGSAFGGTPAHEIYRSATETTQRGWGSSAWKANAGRDLNECEFM